jgi:methyl-accepting chemotaxis protein
VNQSGRTLEEIVASVKRVTDIVSDIAAASAEQAIGIEQVSQAMAQMDKVTQSNSAQTEELSATAKTMNEQAEKMQRLTARFKLSGAESEGAATRMARSGSAMRPARSSDPWPNEAHAGEDREFEEY